jgi:hypothetical protein
MVVGALLFGYGAKAGATTVLPNAAITQVGQQTGFSYFRFANMPSECAAYPIYVDSHYSSDPKAQSRVFLQISSAYLAGKNLSRVDYTLSGQACFLTLIEF